jgi:hypothetical protein
MTRVYSVSRKAAEIALRVLYGESIASIEPAVIGYQEDIIQNVVTQEVLVRTADNDKGVIAALGVDVATGGEAFTTSSSLPNMLTKKIFERRSK